MSYFAVKIADEWRVLFRHEERPEWYRLIAIFASRDRAESYAEIENDLRADTPQMTPDDETEPPPELDAPESRIKLLPYQEPTEPTGDGETKTDALRRMWGEGRNAAEISEALGWSKHSVYSRASELGLKAREKTGNGRPWAEQDEEFTRLWLAGAPARSIAKQLDRTEAAVYARAKNLNLPAHKSGRASPERRVARKPETIDHKVAGEQNGTRPPAASIEPQRRMRDVTHEFFDDPPPGRRA